MVESNSLNFDPPPVDEPNDAIRVPVAGPAAQLVPAPSVVGASASNKRSAARIMVNGRAKAVTSTGVAFQGKVIDMSETGMCVQMDDKPATKQIVTLDCNIFHNGRAHVFQIKAMTVYAILSSGRFKVGFQFDPNSPVATKIIEQLAA